MKPQEQLLDDLAAAMLPDGRTWLDVVRGAAVSCGVNVLALCAPGRSRSVAMAKHRAWHALYTDPTTAYSYPEIGAMWGVDDSTIRHGVARVEGSL